MTYPSNSADSVAQDMLVSYVRRIESTEDEIKALNDDKSEIYKEAKANGFDVKVLRKVIADRRKDAAERSEFEAIYELYWNAVHGLAHAHVEIIEEFGAEQGVDPQLDTPDHDPETGEVVDTSSLPGGSGFATPSAGTGGEADRQPIQESTAARKDVRDNSTGPGARAATADPVAATTPPAGTQAPPVDTIQEPPVLVPADPQWSETASWEDAAIAAHEPSTDFVVFFDGDADARCLNPELCGSNSRLGVCEACQAAWDHGDTA